MATTEFIKSLNIEDNVFEFQEETIVKYLVHFAAPFTGSGEILVPAGIRFAAHGPMRGDALYMHLVDQNDPLLKRLREKEDSDDPLFAGRLMGFSFYITEDEVRELKLNFVKGSRERLLDIFRLLRNAPI